VSKPEPKLIGIFLQKMKTRTSGFENAQ